jgi:N-methylhydantoinase B
MTQTMASTVAADPVLTEVLRNDLEAVTEEMRIVIAKTAKSPILRIGDFGTALADRQGRIIGGNASHVLAANFFRAVIEGALEKWGSDGFAEGDVLLCNDPFTGGSHKPDVFVIHPIFHDDALVGFALAYSHQHDVGGRFSGGMSSHSLNSFDDGVRLSHVKLFEGGRRNEGVVSLFLANIRNGEQFLSDIETKLAGCYRGAQELGLVIDRYGIDAMERCFEQMFDASEAVARSLFAAMPEDTFVGESVLRDDGLGTPGAELLVRASVTFRDGKMLVDFAGTADQIETGINLPIGTTRAETWEAAHAIFNVGAADGGIPYNVGFTRPIEISAPLGCLVNPVFPASVSGRAPTISAVKEAVFRALAVAMPDRVPIPPAGADVVHISGERPDGSLFGTVDLMWNGWGGRPQQDGLDGASCSTFTGIPAEMIEMTVPVVIEEYGFVPDSGGPGQHRGGMSVSKEYRFLQDATVMIRTNQPLDGGEGMAGGQTGAKPRNLYFASDGSELPVPRQGHVHLAVRAGERIHHETGGLGGHGDPSLRDPEAVRADVVTGKLSAAAALEQYGVTVEVEPPTPQV